MDANKLPPKHYIAKKTTTFLCDEMVFIIFITQLSLCICWFIILYVQKSFRLGAPHQTESPVQAKPSVRSKLFAQAKKADQLKTVVQSKPLVQFKTAFQPKPSDRST